MCKLLSHELDRQNDELCAWAVDGRIDEDYLINAIQEVQKDVLAASTEPEIGAATLYGLRAFLAAIVRKKELEDDDD